jgi:glycosyltransferase involved in cell wall biosynthesis
MRILMFDNEYPPLGGGTGVINERVLHEFAQHDDVAVDLITSSRSASSYETERIAERIWMYKVPVDNQNIHHATNVELLRYARRGLWLAVGFVRHVRYDASFAWAGVPAGAMAYAIWRWRRIPYLVSLQGPDVPGFEARYNSIYPLLKPILREVWRNAAHVTASSIQHRDLAYQTLASLTIPVVANGVDVERFSALPRAPDGQTIVCVGRLIERKGQRHLLRTFARVRERFPTAQLQLVGTGDDEATLKALAADLGIAANIAFLGFQPRDAMPAIYQAADIFVLPSQAEGMSVALLEAMSSGLPIITTAAGGTDELIRDGENGILVPWADEDALATALGALLADGAARTRMGAAAREAVLPYSWRAVAETNLALLRGMVR